MTAEIRRLTDPEEIKNAVHLLQHYAFTPTPPLGKEEDTLERIGQRPGVIYLGMYEDGEPVTVVNAHPMTQNVRGNIYKMGGVWGVAAHPKTRRKGYVRQLMTEYLAANREEYGPFSALYPFRESFYQRMGYVSYPIPMIAKFKVASLAPQLKNPPAGEVELLLESDHFEVYRQYIKARQAEIHGMAYFETRAAPKPDQSNWLAVARLDGEVVGIMMYSLKGEPGEFTFNARRFYYHKLEGRYLLLDWIARHQDQAAKAEVWIPAFERPNTWVEDLSLDVEAAWITPMGRVVDIANIGGMQVGPGAFNVQISDPLCPWNEGVWRLESADGKLTVSMAEAADCDLTINGLSALVYGTIDPAEIAFRKWGAVSEDVQNIMRAMFPMKYAHMHEAF